MRVLIAEDDPVSRRLLQAALAKWGYEVTVTTNGKEAWEALQSPNAPSLLVMSGVDATDAALPATVIIETSQQARAAGTPFVVCVRDATKTRVVSTLKELPPYGELRQTALTLLRDALAPS